MLNEHKKEHKVTAATKKIRPKRVVTRRRNELLVATADGGDLDWLDSDTVDLTGIPMDWAEGVENLNDSHPIIDIEKHLLNPWGED